MIYQNLWAADDPVWVDGNTDIEFDWPNATVTAGTLIWAEVWTWDNQRKSRLCPCLCDPHPLIVLDCSRLFSIHARGGRQ